MVEKAERENAEISGDEENSDEEGIPASEAVENGEGGAVLSDAALEDEDDE